MYRLLAAVVGLSVSVSAVAQTGISTPQTGTATKDKERICVRDDRDNKAQSKTTKSTTRSNKDEDELRPCIWVDSAAEAKALAAQQKQVLAATAGVALLIAASASRNRAKAVSTKTPQPVSPN